MPLSSTTYRLSYLQQTDYSNPTQLLEWLKLAEKTIEENEQTINQLINEKEEIIGELTEFKEQAENNKQLLQLINKLEQKAQQSEELVQINSFLQSELTNLQNEIRQQAQQVRQVNQTKLKQDHQLKSLKDVLAEKEEVIKKLRQRITDLNAKENKSRLSRERLEKHLSMNYSKQGQNEIQLQKYQTQIEYLKNKNDLLVQAEQELLQTHEKNTLTNQELRSDLATIAGQLRTNQEQNILLEEKIRELDEELKNSQKEVPLGTNETLSNNLQLGLIAELERKITEQKQNYQRLEQQYHQLFLTHDKLTKEQTTPVINPPPPFWKQQQTYWIGGIVLLFLGGWWFIKKNFN